VVVLFLFQIIRVYQPQTVLEHGKAEQQRHGWFEELVEAPAFFGQSHEQRRGLPGGIGARLGGEAAQAAHHLGRPTVSA
jgi:hypothetical protein